MYNNNIVVLLILLCLIFNSSFVFADQWPMSRRNKRGGHGKARRRKSSSVEVDGYGETVGDASRRRLTAEDACTQCLCYVRSNKHYLDCSLAEVSVLPTNIPVNTSRIWLSGQGLEDIGVTNFLPPLPQLRELLLNGNPISQISSDAFANVSNLRMLLLHYTEIPAIPNDLFSGMTRLRDLWINDALVQSVGEDAFSGLTRLTSLRLFGNNISTFAEGQFAGLNNLEELDVSNNNDALSPSCCAICGVHPDHFSMSSYSNETALTNDKLQCDYSSITCTDSDGETVDCGTASYSYQYGSGSTLYSVVTRVMSISFVTMVSFYLSM